MNTSHIDSTIAYYVRSILYRIIIVYCRKVIKYVKKIVICHKNKTLRGVFHIQQEGNSRSFYRFLSVAIEIIQISQVAP